MLSQIKKYNAEADICRPRPRYGIDRGVQGCGQPVIPAHSGLGSCVAVCVYDSTKKTGGLAHVMSPSSRECTNPDINENRFARTRP